MLIAVLAFSAVMLTLAMFQSKSSMLGFPCGIFWAILGGYAYTQTASFWPPTDIYAFLGIACLLGMLPFSIFAAFGLRTKKEELADGDEFIDEGGGDRDVKFIDEPDEYASPAKYKDYYDEYGEVRPKYRRKQVDEEVINDRSRGVRERAAARRRRFDH